MKTTAATTIASKKQVHGPSRQSIAKGKAKRGKKWSLAEIEILREHYLLAGALGCVQYLPKRPFTAIRVKAGQLNLKYDGYKPWTTEEISILKEKYPRGGTAECAKLLPGRTVNTIRVNARKISLITRRRWLDSEINILLKNYPAGGINACIQLLPHRSRKTIRQRCYLLGIQRT